MSRSDKPTPPAALPRGCTNFKLRQLARRVSRHYDAAMAAAGLKTSQYSLLTHIGRLQPVRPVDLAAQMALEPSTLTRNLQPLIAQGWVLLGEGEDRRSRLISLTPEGLAKQRQAQQTWKGAQLALNDRIGLDRVAQLHALVEACLPLLAGSTDDEPHDETETP